MPINMKMFPGLVDAASKEGSEAFKEGSEAGLKKYLQGKEPEIAGQKQAAQNKANLDTLTSPSFQDQINAGGAAKAGDLSISADPYAHAAMQGPHQAQAFLKNAQGAYKNINDQLDSAKSTVDALDQGNSTADKLALINETRLALGGSGSRAIGTVLPLLSGDPTMGTDAQKALNWLQNTPNIPTLQPAQRDAIREAVFNRLGQVEQQHTQAKQQLTQQGPVVAPQADYNTIIKSLVDPADQKLGQLKQMQQGYAQARQKMQPQPQVSQPATANANPSTLDRLMGFFQKSPAQGAPAGGPQAPMSLEDWKRANGR